MPEFIVEEASPKIIVLKYIIKSDEDIEDNYESQINIKKTKEDLFVIEHSERNTIKFNHFFRFNYQIVYPANYQK